MVNDRCIGNNLSRSGVKNDVVIFFAHIFYEFIQFVVKQ